MLTPLSDTREAQSFVHVHRERLLRQLEQGAQHKLIMIVAGAGYGKTTLMSDFAHSDGLREVWLALTPSHQDPTLLADALASALRKVIPDAEPLPVSRPPLPGAASSPEVLCARLQHLTAHVSTDGVLIILDDYQHVEKSEDANLLLGWLVQNGPANVRFAILSRGAPRLPIGKLRSQQKIYDIGEDDLAFTRDEIEQFLRQGRYAIGDPLAVDAVLGRTEGWPAGVAMICQSFKCSPQDNAMEILGNSSASTQLVWDYLAEEVLGRETPLLQDFMMCTSVLTILTSDACDCLLDLATSRTILRDLEQRHLFISSVDPERETFRYHGLFQEFLQQNLHQRKPSETYLLHLKAAQFFEQRAEWDQCVKHYLSAKRPQEAARIVEAVGLDQILSSSPRAVESWLNAFPESIVDKSPLLLALRGYLGANAENTSAALLALMRALSLYEIAGDQEGQAWTSLFMGMVELRHRHQQRATNRFKSALALAKPGSVLSSWLLAFLGYAYCLVGMVTESAEVLRQAIDGLPTIDDEVQRDYCYSLTLSFMARTQVEVGDLKEARRTAQDALAIGASRRMSRYQSGPIYHSAGVVCWADCDFDAAIPYLTHACTGDMPGPYAAQLTHRHIGDCLRDTERWNEAQQAYASSALDGELEAAFLGILRGEGRDVRKRLVELSLQVSHDESIFAHVALEVVTAELLREELQHEQALLHLRATTDLLSERGCMFNYTGALLHQARIEYELGKPAEGRQSLIRAFGFASQKGLYHFPWWDSRLVAYLCQRAITEGVFPEYAAELARRRLDEKTLAGFGLPPQDPKETLELFLAGCADPNTREALRECLHEALLTEKGLRILRLQFGLTWREIEIFVEYYLRCATMPYGMGAQLRRECARRLAISDNTMQCHVTNIRGKLDLPRSVMGRAVLVWARKQGVLGEKHIDKT